MLIQALVINIQDNVILLPGSFILPNNQIFMVLLFFNYDIVTSKLLKIFLMHMC